jgi:hypothetical protein
MKRTARIDLSLSNALPRFLAPDPASMINTAPLVDRISTHVEFPPYLRVSGPGTASEPRHPHTLIFMQFYSMVYPNLIHQLQFWVYFNLLNSLCQALFQVFLWIICHSHQPTLLIFP